MLLLFILTMTGCFDKSSWSKEGPKSIQRISQDTTLPFPSDSKIAEFVEHDVGFDVSWAAKVVLPKASAQGLLKEIALKQTVDMGIANALSDRVAWWKPQKTAARSRFKTSVGLVDLSVDEEGDKLVAYIQFYTY